MTNEKIYKHQNINVSNAIRLTGESAQIYKSELWFADVNPQR